MNSATILRFPRRETDCRLNRVNRNIEKLAASPSGASAYLVFATAAKLAGEALQVGCRTARVAPRRCRCNSQIH
jgi:hypothetical protein